VPVDAGREYRSGLAELTTRDKNDKKTKTTIKTKPVVTPPLGAGFLFLVSDLPVKTKIRSNGQCQMMFASPAENGHKQPVEGVGQFARKRPFGSLVAMARFALNQIETTESRIG
jgi:hypothetical protein